MRSEYLNSHKFNFNVKEEINFEIREFFLEIEDKKIIKEKLLKMKLI